ncbi:MAG: ERCC4 domain-containing protein [Ruminococcus sp.]|nr:ERCC4 domain-containing protein [Ruminococcus sp.]
MDIFEIKYALEHITILVDTREQNTEQARSRLESMNKPYERKKLDFGDYSAKCALADGGELDFSDSFAVERKMSIDELCGCYCRSRQRFTREFERAKEKGAKLYLLIENATWENIYNGKYRSKMNPVSLTASVLAWLSRYNCQVIFCKAETSGKLIGDIVYREVKERLESG